MGSLKYTGDVRPFPRSARKLTLAVVLLCSLEQTATAHARSTQERPVPASALTAAALDRDIRGFLCTELPSHTAQVSSLTALPARVHGALTTGDSVIERAAIQFTSGAIYADDAPPTGRYDRYSNEYARYVWEAAARVGRKDVLDTLRPSLETQMRLWWDLVSADGYVAL